MAMADERAVTHLAEGRDLYGKGRFEEAKQAFLRALEIHPDDSEALNSLASTLCELNRGEWSEEALTALLASLKSDPQNAKAWNNLGDYHYRRAEFTLAIAAFEKATVLLPDYAVAHVNLALAYRSTHRAGECLEALRCALTLDPESLWTRFQLGLTFLHRGLHDGSTLDLEKAREILLSVSASDQREFPSDRIIRVIDAYLDLEKEKKALYDILLENTEFRVADPSESPEASAIVYH